MSEISPIGPGSGGPVQGPQSQRNAIGDPHHGSPNGHVSGGDFRQFLPARPSERLADQVELSDRARYLDRIRELPEVRMEIVERMRFAIRAGEYPSDRHLTTAIDRMIDDLVH